MIRDKRSIIFRIVLPVMCGIAVAVWLIWQDFNSDALHSIRLTPAALTGIGLAWIFMLGRDLGYAWRFMTLTDGDISWPGAVRVTMLMEFTSAITPTTVGGSALSAVFMHRNGISPGRSTTLMITTLFLDELFFTLACPIIFVILPYTELFGFISGQIDSGLQIIFWCVYGGVVALTAILFCGIFIWPKGVANMITRIFRCRWLRKWSSAVDSLSNDMIATSKQLRKCGLYWWTKAFASTMLSWCSRFLVVNALFLGFAPEADQLVILGRQLVVWIILMVSPTPGGSGVSEWLFTTYYGDLIVGGTAIAVVLSLFWRVVSYYIYLIIGVFMLPSIFKHKQR